MMNKNRAKLLFLIWVGFFFLLSGLFFKGTEAAGISEESIKTRKGNHWKISALELPIPQSDQDRMYLGLEGSGPFKFNQIRTRILIIEVLSSYCPHCQQEAPRVNNLYRHIQERSDLKDKIKIIGIGIGDSPDELNLFKKEYRVPFPLIPDPNNDIGEAFGAKVTPTFVGIRLNDQGPEIFFFQEGGFAKAPLFLNEIMKRSRLKW